MWISGFAISPTLINSSKNTTEEAINTFVLSLKNTQWKDVRAVLSRKH